MNPRPARFWAENSHQSNQGSSIAARMMHSGAALTELNYAPEKEGKTFG